MTNELLTLVLSLVAGAALGAVFFGGLWWTIRRGLVSRRPALLFVGSLLLRSAIVIAGFYFVAGGTWKTLLACLAGFVLIRVALVRLAPPLPDKGRAEAEATWPTIQN
ncbi:MAG: hypothetical protein KDD06_08040 [Phaeodactylibacter sp.]|nr:hypothetical protein [Phaeodactylibacter sp.]MCB9264244.1 ATP synthase subunit I [Lewinellaceae bacterium]MCB9291238.1 ATP synthase subunit I [Lewinellaceae bacterium]